jgi:AraC-like DNA-binding protein
MRFFHDRLAIKVLRSKLFFWSTVPVLVLGAIILVYFSSIKDFPVFPNDQIFDYTFYSDSTAGGDSKILKKVITDSLIKLDYQISNKINAPYAGLNVGPKESKSINIGHYNQLIIRLKGYGINGIGIALVTRNSLKKDDNKSQDILFYHIFKISSGINTYKISTDKFEVPDWWGENNRIEDASTIKPDLKNLETINVSSAFTPNTGKTQSFELYSLTFSRNNKQLTAWVITLEFAFILLVFTALYVIEKMREKKQTITITYKAIENKTTESLKSDFIDFINNNFQNSELTLDLVSSETGVSQRRITNEIQNQFSCNFKSYINRLRINESKRLLLDKELNIGEIAFKVGFNNQSHFNRVFKSELQISPTEYRDKHKI